MRERALVALRLEVKPADNALSLLFKIVLPLPLVNVARHLRGAVDVELLKFLPTTPH
jgi:hypothetical protein